MHKHKYETHIQISMRLQDHIPDLITIKYGDQVKEVTRTDMFLILEVVKEGVFNQSDFDFFSDMREGYLISDWNYRGKVVCDETPERRALS